MAMSNLSQHKIRYHFFDGCTHSTSLASVVDALVQSSPDKEQFDGILNLHLLRWLAVNRFPQLCLQKVLQILGLVGFAPISTSRYGLSIETLA